MTVAIIVCGATDVELADELIEIAAVAERYGISGASQRIRDI